MLAAATMECCLLPFVIRSSSSRVSVIQGGIVWAIWARAISGVMNLGEVVVDVVDEEAATDEELSSVFFFEPPSFLFLFLLFDIKLATRAVVPSQKLKGLLNTKRIALFVPVFVLV